jgi:hypothetical protein
LASPQVTPQNLKPNLTGYRFDPNAEIPENIETPDQRVKFMLAVTQLFVTKARIKVSPVKLYYADWHALPELIKIASLLYNVYTTDGMEDLGARKYFPPFPDNLNPE